MEECDHKEVICADFDKNVKEKDLVLLLLVLKVDSNYLHTKWCRTRAEPWSAKKAVKSHG